MQIQRDITIESATQHILIKATLRDLKQSIQNLNLVKKQTLQQNQLNQNPAKKPRLSRSKYRITSFDKCIICQREKTQKKGTKQYEPLSNCETFQDGRTLLYAAKVRQDERIIVATE